METSPIVYIVDDDAAVREQLCFTVKSVGTDVMAFESAERFLQSFDASRPACLVLDVRLSGMDGLALQSHLRNQDIVMPIIMISGHGDITMAVEAMQSGAITFLEKPFREQRLLNCIRDAIDSAILSKDQSAKKATFEVRLASLSKRELEVLDRFVTGESNITIAKHLHISPKTVESHRTHIMEKMQAKSAVDLVRIVLTNRTPVGSV